MLWLDENLGEWITVCEILEVSLCWWQKLKNIYALHITSKTLTSLCIISENLVLSMNKKGLLSMNKRQQETMWYFIILSAP